MHSTTPGTFLQSNKSLAASNKSSFKPTELTANSGYMADDNISQARTPGKVKTVFLRSLKYFWDLAASNKSSFKPTELTANSGYMADDNISQAKTPGNVKIFFEVFEYTFEVW